jgi:hypothetical protein
MVLTPMLLAQVESGPAYYYTAALMVPVYTAAVLMVGAVLALIVALWRTDSPDRPDTIRALGDLFGQLFRWFRGGPPTR